jgi:hypothetical protein
MGTKVGFGILFRKGQMDFNSDTPNDTQDTVTETNGPMMLAFDIPLTTTADEAARLVNEPYTRGFYVHSIVQWPGVGARVFLRRHVRLAVKPTNSDLPPPTREARAMQFIRDNREMTNKELSAALKALGFPRSVVWIGKKRLEVFRAERRANPAG